MQVQVLVLTEGAGVSQPGLIDRATEPRSMMATLRSMLAYRELIRNLVMKELKLKYRGSVLGFFWSLLNPLAMVATYTLAFKYIIGIQQPGFAFFILPGIMAWTFFANASMLSTGALIEGTPLIKAVAFPRAILPLSTTLFCLIQYVLMIVTVLPLTFLFYKVPSPGLLLLFPVFLTLQLAFTVGASLVLAAATTFFRDVRHFVEIALPILFWLTPIVYQLSQAPPWLRTVLLASPMSAFVVAYQRIFYYGTWPAPSEWLAAACWGIGTFVLGAGWFSSLETSLADHL